MQVQLKHGSYDVSITEAKATNANGIVTGNITKKDDGSESNKYLKIDFFNKRNALMGTKYVDVGDVKRRRE